MKVKSKDFLSNLKNAIKNKDYSLSSMLISSLILRLYENNKKDLLFLLKQSGIIDNYNINKNDILLLTNNAFINDEKFIDKFSALIYIDDLRNKLELNGNIKRFNNQTGDGGLKNNSEFSLQSLFGGMFSGDSRNETLSNSNSGGGANIVSSISDGVKEVFGFLKSRNEIKKVEIESKSRLIDNILKRNNSKNKGKFIIPAIIIGSVFIIGGIIMFKTLNK